MTNIFLSLFIAFISSIAVAGAPVQNRVIVAPASNLALEAGTIRYVFNLVDETTHKSLSETDLVETHTKILHLIAYDSSRHEFNHVHPQFDGHSWSVDLELSTNGKYLVWAQGQLADGTEFSTATKAEVVHGKSEIPVAPLGDVRKGKDQATILELSPGQLKAGKMAMLGFRVFRDDGQQPLMSPYLGAVAHVIAASPDGDELVHVHPMEGNKPNTGMIHATFQTAGDYRIWVQFMDRGELKTIPLSVRVNP